MGVLSRGVERLKWTQSLCQVEMKIMIDCGRLIERNDLRKVVSGKKGVKEEKTRRKEKQRCEIFS